MEVDSVTERPLIYRAMASAVADVEAIGKTRTNPQQGYSYRGYDDLVPLVKAAMAKQGIIDAMHSIDDVQVSEYDTRNGTRMQHVIVRATYRFYAADGSYIETHSMGEGSDSGDKAVNKSLTSCEKNMLVHRFKLATGDADDTERESPERAARPAAPSASRESATRETVAAAAGGITEAQAGVIIGRCIKSGEKHSRHGFDVLGECLMAIGLPRQQDRSRKPEVIAHLRKNLSGKKMDVLLGVIDGWPESVAKPDPGESAPGVDDKFVGDHEPPPIGDTDLPF